MTLHHPRRAVAIAVTTVVVAMGAAAPRASAALPRPLWRYSLPTDPWGVTADDDGVIVTTGLGHVVALDRGGHERWTAKITDLQDGNPALGDGVALFGTTNYVIARDRATGATLWRHEDFGSVPAYAIGNGLALVGDVGTVTALDLNTGMARWSVRYGGYVAAPPRIVPGAGVVVVLWDGVPEKVRALDLASGALRWESETGVYAAAPVVRRGLVVIADGDGHFHARVHALDLAGGTEQWSTVVPASFQETIEPAATDDAVAIVDELGTVSLVDLASGRIKWQQALDDGVLTTRVVITGRSVVLSAVWGTLVVLDRDSGGVRARGLPGGKDGVISAIDVHGSTVFVGLRHVTPPRLEARRLQ
jgi:outer membrane protein assembly factor BamB